MFFLMVKSLQFIVNTMVFEGLTGCVRERKMYQKQIRNEIQTFPELVGNRCENDAWESDAKIMEFVANMESKR